MTDRPDESEPTKPQDEDAPERPRSRRPLTDEERRDLDRTARPGAVYSEAAWKKRAREPLRRIERAIDQLEAPDSSPRAVARRRRAREGELPAGLRSRITEHLGPVAYVQLSYSTREHHVCHVGLRDDGSIEDAIVLVGPGGVRRFEDVGEAVDELTAEADHGGEPGEERAEDGSAGGDAGEDPAAGVGEADADDEGPD